MTPPRGIKTFFPWVALLLLASGAILVSGCVGFTTQSGRAASPVRISDHLYEGDAQRRASMQLVAAGLDADLSGDSHRALAQYERAIGVDPNNPYAYLALTRHLAERGDVVRASSFLERAEILFESEKGLTPGVRVHIKGLKGQLGGRMAPPRASAAAERAEAARYAPDIWSDGRLSPDELL